MAEQLKKVTTALPVKLIEELEQYKADTGVSKHRVIIAALEMFFDEKVG